MKIQLAGGIVVLIVLLAAMTATLAQPQAPVAWGEPRWLGLHDGDISPNQVTPTGDSLVFCGISHDQHRVFAAYSFDNGQTHSEWQQMAPTASVQLWISMAASGANACAFIRNWSAADCYTRVSHDGGETWVREREARFRFKW